MITLDNEPLSLIERTGFKRLLQQVLLVYKLPSRTYITKSVIPDIYDRIYRKIRWNISNALAISDIWTYLYNNGSFLSRTAHWLLSEFKLEHGVSVMKRFLDLHIGENIAQKLYTVANNWHIDHFKIHVQNQDSTYMVKGIRLIK